MTTQTVHAPLPGCGLAVDVCAGSAVAWVHVAGDLDIATAGRLAAVLSDVREAGHRVVTVDLSGVEFLGAAGLNTLVAADNDLRREGGGLRTVAARPFARQLFGITGLDHLLAGPASEPSEGAGV